MFDYLPSTAVLVASDTFNSTAQAFYAEAEERFEQRKYDVERPILKPDLLFLPPEELIQRTTAFARITFDNKASDESSTFTCHPLPNVTLDAKLNEPAQALQQFISTLRG